MVGQAGRRVDDVWRWDLLWRRHLFVWENELLTELLAALEGVIMSDTIDRWIWKPGNGGLFSVKSTYVFLDSTLNISTPRSSLDSFAFKFIWKSGVPSKVSALSWQLLLNKIPTRENLRRRNVLSLELGRVEMCFL
jgi:hypothetical protein